MKWWKLAAIGSMIGNGGFILALIVGMYEVDGHYIINFAKGIRVGIYPCIIGVILMVIALIMSIKDDIKK